MNSAFTIILVALPAYLLVNGKLTNFLKLAGTKNAASAAGDPLLNVINSLASGPSTSTNSLLPGLGAALTSPTLGNITN